MCRQVKGAAQGEAGGVWLERSAQSALQRYFYFIHLHFAAVLCSAVCAAPLKGFNVLVSPDVIKEKGLEHVTVEDLVTVITPKGRGTDIQMQRGWILICSCDNLD